MRSIELVLDDETDAVFRRDWDALLQAGLPSQGRHTGASNRPHITLGAGATFPFGDDGGDEEIEPDGTGRAESHDARLVPIIASLSALPLEVDFSGLVVFGAPPKGLVLARLVVLSPALLALHAAVHERSSGATDLTRPGAWTPHVTLAHRMTPDQLAAALPLIAPTTSGRAVGARLWDSATREITALG